MDKAHRGRICLPINVERPRGWILSYGYEYWDGLNTIAYANEVAKIVKKKNYNRVGNLSKDSKPLALNPLSVIKEISEISQKYKGIPGLIHYGGHGAMYDFYNFHGHSDLLRFPQEDECEHKHIFLGDLKLSSIEECSFRCRYLVHDIGDIKKYNPNDKPLIIVKVILLFGCSTGTFLAQRINKDLGAKVVVATQCIMYINYHGKFMTAFWESLANGTDVNNAVKYAIGEVNNYLKEKLKLPQNQYEIYKLINAYIPIVGEGKIKID